jgi:hypothetical protein
MSQEIELAAKATGAIAQAILAESGLAGPLKARLEAITAGIHYHDYPRVVEKAMVAAARIKASKLPRRAYDEIPDPLLRVILENTAKEADETLSDAWVNLLANLVTVGTVEVRRAFPKILASLEPEEARLLDAIRASLDGPMRALMVRSPELNMLAIENLSRSKLIEDVTAPTIDGERRTTQVVVTLTDLGQAFVAACQPPMPEVEVQIR